MAAVMCQERFCVLEAEWPLLFCRIHQDAVLAVTAGAVGTCGRCHRAISLHDFVSRTMLQERDRKHRTTRFSWQHAHCAPTPRQPTRAERRKAVKPLFLSMLLDVE